MGTLNFQRDEFITGFRKESKQSMAKIYSSKMIMAISRRHGYFQSMCVRLIDDISNNKKYTYEIINVSVLLRSGLMKVK